MEEEVKPKNLLFHFHPLTELGSRNLKLGLTVILFERKDPNHKR